MLETAVRRIDARACCVFLNAAFLTARFNGPGIGVIFTVVEINFFPKSIMLHDTKKTCRAIPKNCRCRKNICEYFKMISEPPGTSELPPSIQSANCPSG